MFGGRLTIKPTRFQSNAEESDTLFYAPVSGNKIPLLTPDGTGVFPFLESPTDQFVSFPLAGLTPDSEYDVWAIQADGIQLAIIGLAAWTPKKPFGSGAFGRGAFGSYPFPQVIDAAYDGIPSNPDPVNLQLADGTQVTAAPNSATFLGSVRISCDGKITCHQTYRGGAEWGVYNAQNQKRIILKGGDPKPFNLANLNAPGTYSPNWAPYSDASFLKVFTGRPETIDCHYHHACWMQAFVGNEVAPVISGAIGFNRKSGFNVGDHQVIANRNPDGHWWQRDIENNLSGNYIAEGNSQAARFVRPGSAGTKDIWALIWTQNVLKTTQANQLLAYISMWGQEQRMLLTAEWDG